MGRRFKGKTPLRFLLAALCVAAAAPVGFLFVLSLRGGYAGLFAAGNPFWAAAGNSLLICGASLAGQLVTSVLGGWGLAKYRFPGRTALLFACIVLMLLPVQAVLLPQYLLLRSCGLLNTLWALVLPGVFSPLGTVLLWHGFTQFPTEIAEAAQAEGAGWFTVLWRIVLPGCRRELAVLALISLAESWNLLEQPMAYLKTPELYPLSVYLATTALPDPARRAAACLTALAPVAAFFFVLIRFVLPQPKKPHPP